MMNSPLKRLGLAAGLAAVLIAWVALLLLPSLSVLAEQQTTSSGPATVGAPSNGAALHNPAFDNHLWYWFNNRYPYSSLSPSPFVPDDDVVNGPQQWMLWFKDGTVPVYTWATDEKLAGDKAVKGRTHWNGSLQGGLYQIVYNTTPCLTYEFEMYGKFKLGESGDVLHAFRVGIDRVGYRPTDWAVQDFPSTMVWGSSNTSYINTYGPLTATAEAWSDKISVYTYAQADGGTSAEFLWDSGTFEEATPPDLISDPDNPPAASGISGLWVNASSTSATMNWNTSADALGQVYYRLASTPSTPVSPTTGLTRTVYLPLISRAPNPWLSTSLNESPTTAHSEGISGLQPGSTYEYIVASRGLSGGQCATWVSSKQQFTTASQ
jgi:hypothetical protein